MKISRKRLSYIYNRCLLGGGFYFGRKYVYWFHAYVDNDGIYFLSIYREPLNSSDTECIYDSIFDGPLDI